MGRGGNFLVEPLVPVLIHSLDDQDVKVRRDVVSALRWCGRKAASAEEALRRLAAGDEDRLVQLRAQVALRAVTGHYPETSKSRDNALYREMENLERDLHELEMALKSLSGSCHARFTSSTLITIRQLGPKALEALPLVLNQYDNCRDEMAARAAAVRAMGAIETSDRVKTVLIRAFSDPQPMVRKAAAETAGVFPPDDQLISVLIKSLEDEDYKVVMAAADSLGRFKDGRAVEPLIFVLNNYETNQKFKTKKARKAAAEALKQIGTPEALAALEK